MAASQLGRMPPLLREAHRGLRGHGWLAVAGTTAAGLSEAEIAGPLAEDTAAVERSPRRQLLPALTIASLLTFVVKNVSLSALHGRPPVRALGTNQKLQIGFLFVFLFLFFSFVLFFFLFLKKLTRKKGALVPAHCPHRCGTG